MPTLGITVLKNNAPWGPFTREQIDEGLARGDFTLKYLAHATGMSEWHPLGEVLDYVERNAGPRMPFLPPVPMEARGLPPVPLAVPPPASPVPKPEPLVSPVIAPVAEPKRSSPPPPLPLSSEKPVIAPKPEPAQIPVSEISLPPGSLFRRFIAFVVDFGVLFIPLGILWIIGALSIELPAKFHHVSHQVRMDEWDLLKLNTWRLFLLDAIGFGWLYGAGMEASQSEATIGKRWFRIRVTDLRGERIGFVRASIRHAAKYLSALPCYLGYLSGSDIAFIIGSIATAGALLMPVFSSKNLTLHDRLSDTRVVKR